MTIQSMTARLPKFGTVVNVFAIGSEYGVFLLTRPRIRDYDAVNKEGTPMPTDLKSYKAKDDSFAIFSEEEAATILLVVLAGLILLDVLGVWA